MVKTDVSCTDRFRAKLLPECSREGLGCHFDGPRAPVWRTRSSPGASLFQALPGGPAGSATGDGVANHAGGPYVKLWVSTPLPHPPRSSQGRREERTGLTKGKHKGRPPSHAGYPLKRVGGFEW